MYLNPKKLYIITDFMCNLIFSGTSPSTQCFSSDPVMQLPVNFPENTLAKDLPEASLGCTFFNYQKVVESMCYGLLLCISLLSAYSAPFMDFYDMHIFSTVMLNI